MSETKIRAGLNCLNMLLRLITLFIKSGNNLILSYKRTGGTGTNRDSKSVGGIQRAWYVSFRKKSG
ncbi:MAG: hypothetical protein GY795_17465 [Desulfobacterales bacterium]|nr:hypothetical protein [Desulfobacterales bacterium]